MAKVRSQPGIADVAREAGVALSTVSRVLNNRTEGFSVKPKVRSRILAAAEELDYRPNPVLRSLRAKRTNMIALVGVQTLNPNPSVNELAVRRLVHILNDTGYHACMNFFSREHKPGELPPWRVDGAVVVGATGPQLVEEVEQRGVPYVSINGYVGPRGGSVQVDDEMGTRLAIDHLLELGHRRIAYVNANILPDHNLDATHQSVAIRHRTYLQSLSYAGLESVPGHDNLAATDEELLRGALVHGATAVLAYNHMQALRILRVAHALGLQVPGDFSLMCFNNHFPVTEVSPPLTAVALPADSMGERAAKMLLEQLNAGADEVELETVLLKEQLVVRQSTASPPGGAR